MKSIALVILLAGGLGLTGCATRDDAVGADVDRYGTVRGRDAADMSSPTFRPGMRPDDIRDPNSLTQPLPPTQFPQQ